jgi:hypothetical protein
MAEEVEVSYGKGHRTLPYVKIPILDPWNICTQESKYGKENQHYAGCDMFFHFAPKAIVFRRSHRLSNSENLNQNYCLKYAQTF